MPSFLNDENSVHYSQSSDVIHLDSALVYGTSPEKSNGRILQQSQCHPSSDDSFEESSTHSTQTSDLSEPRTQLNDDCLWPPPSMGHLPDGPHTGGTNGLVHDNRDGERGLPNGLEAVSIPDPPSRLPPPTPPMKDLTEHELPTPSPKDVQPTTSVDSTAQQCPLARETKREDKTESAVADGFAAPAAANTSNARSDNLAVPGRSTLNPPAAMSPVAAGSRTPSSPHRFSSPPLYNPTSATSPSSSGSLQPPGGGLKHRNTLEVPKVAPGRGSRDSNDAGFASGRFSPTVSSTTALAAARRTSLSLGRRNTRSLHSEHPRDEIVPDEDALRWAEAYRQKRASKRRRMERDDDDRVLVGTKVDENHANWVTAYNMLTGIRVSVSRTNAKVDRPLTDADFEAKQKSTFDIAGNELVPSAKYDFKFKDYAPWVFRHLRALFRLDPADYLMSLTGKYILSELGSPGKSGSFFYFSRDYKYIIKTIHHGEHKFLRKMLKDYYQHVVENPNTLLSQFYGLHRVKMPYGKKIHFVIMNNLFPPHRDIHQTFDLKGSTFGRDFKEEDLEKNPRATLKDLNWLRRHKHLELGIEKKRLFLEQLRKDVKLLQRLEIMDYSLLIGIHDVQRGNEENLRDKTLQVFNPGGNNTEEFDPSSVLMRTPSKLENMRKARELRQMIKAERPVPLGQSSSRMPDELENNQSKQGFIFYQDDGGFRATHEDNTPADEIYYLGVIDCLTHYGIVKKIEHFWKGLSHDRSQISALPPDQYGDRFINFISGVTMSAEEAARLEQEKNRAAAEAARTTKSAGRKASTGDGRTSEMGQTSSGDANAGVRALEANQISSSQSQQSSMVPALDMSPKADETLQRAEEQARKTEKRGAQEDSIPERVLRTSAVTLGAVGAPSVSKHGQGSSPDRRESSTASPPAILPVLEEATEANSTATQSQTSHSSNTATEEDNRPLTPAKDGKEKDSGFSDVLLGAHGRLNGNRGPPTPPKTGYGRTVHAKPGSADSGYGVASGTVSANSTVAPMHHKPLNLRPQVSRDSLDKALPPLPKSGMQSQGLS